jgi:hypothetical protein
MPTKTEDRWRCTNPACGCEVLVQTTGIIDAENPRCSCGAVIKKKYVPPMLTYLDFLRLEEVPGVASRKE